jgi:hypothetical protein
MFLEHKLFLVCELSNILNVGVSILNNQGVHIVAFYTDMLVWLSLFHMVIGSALSLLNIDYDLDIQKVDRLNWIYFLR